MSSKSKTLADLFLHHLKDLYYAEKHMGKALSKLGKAASDEALQQTLERDRDGTHSHVDRLEQVFELLDKKVHGVPCEAIQGIIEEAKELLQDFDDSPALDAGVIAAAQAMHLYAVARYGSLRTWASQLGLPEVVRLLETSLAEERQANDRLDSLAGNLKPAPNPDDAPAAARLTLKTAALSGLR